MTLKLDFSNIRKQSWSFVAGKGLGQNDDLPLLDDVTLKVSPREVADRLLCMYAAAAAAFGLKAESAFQWLETEGLASKLSKSERSLLAGDVNQLFIVQLQVHSAHALAWCSNLVSEQCLMENLPEDFVSCFPDIREHQSTRGFVDRINFRGDSEIAPYLDRAYCLHWALRDAQIRLQASPKLRWLPSVEAHRHALEWLIAGGAWDDVPMDT